MTGEDLRVNFMKIVNPRKMGLRKIDPSELYRQRTPRLLRSSILLPSQYDSYAICTEFARDWFLDKFSQNYFNSIYIDGSKSFDEFRKFSHLDIQMKRSNPVMAIVPNINLEHNRSFIDTNPELTGYMRRTRMEGTFFADKRPNKGLYAAIQFKTILMTFLYKIRVDTKAEAMDLIEFIKYKHRAQFTETQNITLDVHIPKKIIAQIAFDNGIANDTFSGPKDQDKMLKYLNTWAIAPIIYKRRNATGTGEYFLHVPNCVAHIKSELPSMDDGTRQDSEIMNYVVEFQIEVEMTAPYCYTYYSQHEQSIINSNELAMEDTAIIVMKAVRCDLPDVNEADWPLILRTEYIVDKEDLKNNVVIDFNQLLDGEILDIVNYTHAVALSPSLFMDFLVFNDDRFQDYDIDWNTNTLTLKNKCIHPSFIIGIYVNMSYVNNTLIHHNFDNGLENPDSFRTTSRIGKIEDGEYGNKR